MSSQISGPSKFLPPASRTHLAIWSKSSHASARNAIRVPFGHMAGIEKPASYYTLRHFFATHLLESGYDIRTVQELPGHNDVHTPMVYTHVLNRPGLGCAARWIEVT